VFSTGNFIGAMIAPPLVAWLALHYRWQLSFVITGASGFVLLGVWLWFYHSPEQQPWLSAAERTVILHGRGSNAVAQQDISMFRLLSQPAIRSFFFTRFLTDTITFFFLFWLPAYLQTSHGFSLAKTGMMAWIPFLGADLGALTGGAISDSLVRHGTDSRVARRRILFGVACLTPLTLLAVRVSAPLALTLITLVMFLQAAWNTNLTTLIIESTLPQNVARVVALTLMGGSVGGGLSTLLAGHVIKNLGYIPVFTALGFTHLTAYALMSISLRRQMRTSPAIAHNSDGSSRN
jgi:ACS family hexuronate transporter-like MFS transporter